MIHLPRSRHESSFRVAITACIASVALLLSWAGARADTPAQFSAERPRWGFSTNLGVGEVSGEFDPLFTTEQVGEYAFFQHRGPWRFGAAISFGSFDMEAPYQNEQEWGFMRGDLFVSRMLNLDGRFRPYLQARVGVARLHPRSELFAMDPLPPDFEVGDSPNPPTNGWNVALVPGIEWRLGRALAIDLSGKFTTFSVDDYDLSPVGMEPAGSGTTVEGRLGLTWFPYGEFVSDTSDAARDAWGVKPSYGWAAGEVLAINLGASYFNEYVRNANFNQISPRSWKDNLTGGFHFDDNQFRTNQYIHPFNGSTYYNSGRANGLDFWSSSVAGIGGAFVWEAFGETHPMSFNDMISTGIGGIALGEVMYRMSSLVLDNTDTGSSRTWREVGAFLIDPVRGFNRFLSDRGSEVGSNPAEPMDWRPQGQENWVAAGVRFRGEGESISDSLQTHAYLELTHAHGNVFENPRSRPFDYFDLSVQFNFGDKVPLGRAIIRGNIWSKPLGNSADPKHVLSLTQHFEYVNNNAFEYGGQSYGPSLFSRFGAPGKTQIRTRADLLLTILGAVNSDYAFLAEVENRERFREYDYGPGVGGGLWAAVRFPNRISIDASYRVEYLDVRNGSVYQTETEDGSDASHVVQAALIRALVPVRKNTSIGADAGVFMRNSDYSLGPLEDVRQRNPQLRAYLVWSAND